jgi:hypothetical protein
MGCFHSTHALPSGVVEASQPEIEARPDTITAPKAIPTSPTQRVSEPSQATLYRPRSQTPFIRRSTFDSSHSTEKQDAPARIRSLSAPQQVQPISVSSLPQGRRTRAQTLVGPGKGNRFGLRPTNPGECNCLVGKWTLHDCLISTRKGGDVTHSNDAASALQSPQVCG